MHFKIHSVILCIYKRDYSTRGNNGSLRKIFSCWATLSVSLSFCLFVYLSLCLIVSLCLSLSLSVSLSLSLSVSLGRDHMNRLIMVFFVNQKLYFLLLRRDKAFCDECRFCCTVPFCSHPTNGNNSLILQEY